MKKTLSIIIFLLSFFRAFSQDATEIIAQTESAYSKLTNYVDSGSVIMALPGSVGNVIQHYTIAMDREGNISHTIVNAEPSFHTDYAYFTAKGDDSGVFIRSTGTTDTSRYTPDIAGARLTAAGGGILFFYQQLLPTPSSKPDLVQTSPLNVYDKAMRLMDTVLNGQTCYVVQTTRSILITQERIDQSNKSLDSMYLAEQGTTRPENLDQTKPGLKTFTHTYFIRKTDFMILSWSQEHQNDHGSSSKRIVVAHPRYNVPDFEKYLARQ